MRTLKVVTVTHNNEDHIQWLLDGLEKSCLDITIELIDSGSNKTEYLDGLVSKHKVFIRKEENIGFVKGNNIALDDINEFEWVLFLNPDARVEGDELDEVINFFSKPTFCNLGVITLPLVKYDIKLKKNLMIYDSVGIKCDLFGRWVDIDSGVEVREYNNKNKYHEVEAICGAFMLIKSRVLNDNRDKKGELGFESSYQMYKEDIELSKRISKSGLKNIVFNKYNAFHCRGWNPDRSKVPYWARKNSAINDIDVAFRYKKRALFFALAKYIWVMCIEKR